MLSCQVHRSSGRSSAFHLRIAEHLTSQSRQAVRQPPLTSTAGTWQRAGRAAAALAVGRRGRPVQHQPGPQPLRPGRPVPVHRHPLRPRVPAPLPLPGGRGDCGRQVRSRPSLVFFILAFRIAPVLVLHEAVCSVIYGVPVTGLVEWSRRSGGACCCGAGQAMPEQALSWRARR